jgi:outer membrane protein assembly factor BamB
MKLFLCRILKQSTLLAFLALLCGPTNGFADSTANWPQFRGPHASGFSADAAPLTWNVESGQNVRWQTPIPGLGHACPIIWNDRIFVATVVKPSGKAEIKVGLYGDGGSYPEKETHDWHLLCLEKKTGKVRWDKVEYQAVPRLERHTKASHCNSTPATDGQRIVAIFGSEGLFCFDLDGKLLWRKDLGRMNSGPYDMPTLQWSFGSSPVLHEGKVIVQCDVLAEQFLAVFDAQDGRELWRVPRKEVSTWCTPIISDAPGRSQIIVNGWKNIAGYDFRTGKEFWRLNGGGDVPVASPILANDCVILTSGHGQFRPMRAVSLSASGDITPPDMVATNKSVIWCHPRQGNYLQTPIVVGDLLWGCSNDGIVTCFDVQTGKIQYNERIGGGGQGFTASPVAAKDRIYFTGEQGDVFVLPATNQFSILATNHLGGLCLSTPAISDGTLFFRTTETLIAIGAR